MPPPRQWMLVALLAALGLLAWWLQTQRPPPSLGPDTRRTPDYTADEIAVTLLDENGRLERKLRAWELRHYPDGSGNEFEEPRLVFYRDDGPPWQVRAERGQGSEDGDEIQLLGAVFIDRAAGEQNRPVHIATFDLWIRVSEEYARTGQPVHLVSDADWVNSVTGGEIWFGDSLRTRLFGRVRQQLTPAPPEPAAP